MSDETHSLPEKRKETVTTIYTITIRPPVNENRLDAKGSAFRVVCSSEQIMKAAAEVERRYGWVVDEIRREEAMSIEDLAHHLADLHIVAVITSPDTLKAAQDAMAAAEGGE
jgi:ribosome-binding protein aMBF1 (putative translation factor)